MGFEVNFSYYDKLEDSFDYDKTESKSFKKTFGKAIEEYPLEKLAQAIMQQMARRDIFVFDIEIFEFQKKKISFRQNKSDLVIKNKKFTNKGIFIEDVQEDCIDHACHSAIMTTPTNNVGATQVPANMPAINIAPPLRSNQPVNLLNDVRPQGEKIIKHMQFLPGRMSKPIGSFTVEKVYPVYREILNSNGVGMTIETVDDKSRRVKVPDEHFVPIQQQLIGDEEARFSQSLSADNRLNWNGVVNDSVPKLR